MHWKGTGVLAQCSRYLGLPVSLGSVGTGETGRVRVSFVIAVDRFSIC